MLIDNLRSVDVSSTGLDVLAEKHEWPALMPDDTEWFEGTLACDEIGHLVHIYAPVWKMLSSGSGLVCESAERIERGDEFAGEVQKEADAICRIAEDFCIARLGRLMLGMNSLETGPRMVVDGNHRAVALELMRLKGTTVPVSEIGVIVALSKSSPLRAW